MTTIQTREQVRAQRAWTLIRKVQQEDRSQAAYKRFAKAFPALLQASGLCQALAFAQAKGPRAYVSDLAEVIGTTAEELLESSRESNLTEYLRITREALSSADWLQRYADALLRDEDETK